MGTKQLKRKIHRATEELRATFEIARHTSIKQAFNTFMAKIDIQRFVRNGYVETPVMTRRFLAKHATMVNYFEKKYKDWWDNYKRPEMPDVPENLVGKVWMCWWQGVENAPEIVKKCIQSVQDRVGKDNVIVITDENVNDYVEFPPHIVDKVKRGIISRTHFSDMLRFNLLSRYGGAWLDATFYCTGNEILDYLRQPIWSIKRPEYNHASAACGYFAGYSISSNDESRWAFRVMLDFLFNYWVSNNYLIDYLTISYSVVLTQKHFPEVKKLFDAIEPNNKYCDDLVKELAKPFDPEAWHKLQENTSLYKLTWKARFPKEVDGKPTFYAKLLSGELQS